MAIPSLFFKSLGHSIYARKTSVFIYKLTIHSVHPVVMEISEYVPGATVMNNNAKHKKKPLIIHLITFFLHQNNGALRR